MLFLSFKKSLSHFSFENFPFKVKTKILIKIFLNYWIIFHNFFKNDYKIYISKNNYEIDYKPPPSLPLFLLISQTK
jgi:hypothetical protein